MDLSLVGARLQPSVDLLSLMASGIIHYQEHLATFIMLYQSFREAPKRFTIEQVCETEMPFGFSTNHYSAYDFCPFSCGKTLDFASHAFLSPMTADRP